MLFPDHYNEIKSMKVDNISRILKTPEGFYVFKILDHSQNRKMTLEEDWAMVEKFALQHKQQRLFNEWLEKVSKHYYIEIK